MAKQKLKITYVKTKKLKLWRDNPRKNDEAAKRLSVLLKTHGVRSPIVVWRKTNEVLKGNTVLKAARLAGIKELPVTYQNFKNVQEARAYAIADNKASEWAEWDDEKLVKLFGLRQKLPDKKLAQQTGFTQVEIEGVRSSTGGFAAHSFGEIVEEFEEKHGKSAKKRVPWSWLLCPSIGDRAELVRRLGRSDGWGHELDYGKLAKKLGMKLGKKCKKCKGTGGKAEGGKHTCTACGGTGYRPVYKEADDDSEE